MLTRAFHLPVLLVCLLAPSVRAEPPKDVAQTKGLRVFVAGHSFLMPVTDPIAEVAKSAGMSAHETAGRQSIGGSRTLQHWDLPEERNKAKAALRTGKIDALIVSPHVKLPDEGIDRFAELALEHNKNARILVQASWYLFDAPGRNATNFKNADRNNARIDELRKAYEPFYKALAGQVKGLNETHKKPVVALVPVGHAVMRLREKVVAKEAPGVAAQADLFTDPIGHARPPVIVLTAYCHYAVLYGKKPSDLPVPVTLARAGKKEDMEKLNRLLQEIAWETVTQEPLTGVKR